MNGLICAHTAERREPRCWPAAPCQSVPPQSAAPLLLLPLCMRHLRRAQATPGCPNPAQMSFHPRLRFSHASLRRLHAGSRPWLLRHGGEEEEDEKQEGGKKRRRKKKTNVCARFCLRRRSTGEKVWRSRLLIGDARFGRKSRRRRRVRLEERYARPRARQGDAPPARVLFSSDEQRNGCAVHLSSAGGCAGRLRSSQHGFATGEA